MKNFLRNNIFVLLFISMFTISLEAFAHGANIQYRQTQAIEIKATYDDGKPMKEAQVIVYSSQDPATPWLKGITDAEGRFTFVPNSSKPGNWDVQVRQSGHGNMITIPWQGGNIPTQTQEISFNNSGYTTLQKVVMAAVVIWGFLGTSLFFFRRQVKQ